MKRKHLETEARYLLYSEITLTMTEIIFEHTSVKRWCNFS